VTVAPRLSTRSRVPGFTDPRQRGEDLSSIPAAMQLRYLQTLAEIGAEQNSTVVFPMPIDIIKRSWN